MTSCLWLERPAAWRPVGVGLILAFVTLPTWPLLWETPAVGNADWPDVAFLSALRNSLEIAGGVAVAGLLIGIPAGLAAALYEFPGRKAFLLLTTLPLLVPTFLWAIGWSSLTARLGPSAAALMEGRTGCCLVFLASAVPVVMWVTYAATRSLSGTQIEAARLAGGERAVVHYTARFVGATACLAAVLAGVLTMSDPGPGQILGRRTAASEVLTSFSSLYDFRLAGRQCLVLTLAVVVAALPVSVLASRRLAAQILARQTRRAERVAAGRVGILFTLGFAAFLVLTMAAPLAGLLLPITSGVDVGRAGREVWRTGFNTLVYAVGAGLVAASLSVLLAACAGRSERLRTVVLGVSLVSFALPPSLAGLGIVRTATSAPPWLDWLMRSRVTVCLDLGLRFFPIAALIALRGWGTLSPSWTHAAALHGVPLGRYLTHVVVPHLSPAVGATLLLIGLLATADVSSVLLLHPPGQSSLPLAIFTVMANAPESLVASLCFAYLGLAFGIMTVCSLTLQRLAEAASRAQREKGSSLPSQMTGGRQ